MKKTLLLVAMALLGLTRVSAQDADDLGIFNHLSVGAGVGTTGITIDLAAPVTPYVAVRAGVDIFPNVKVNTDLDIDVNVAQEYEHYISGYTIPKDVKVEGKTDMIGGNAHVLFDFFPFKKSSFHLTAGAYFGKDKVVSLYNKDDGALKVINQANQILINEGIANPNTHENMIGLDLGDFFLTPDENGNVDATLKVSKFRPYVGLGFGRPVPMKHRFTCNFDLGVQFWGTPEVYLRDNKLEKTTTNSDAGEVLKVISKISVYPSLNIRFVGRIL